MKCENCGKNEATFYYKSNVNGQMTEKHLCSDCAKAMGYVDEWENFGTDMMRQMDALFAPMRVPMLAGGFFPSMGESLASFFPELGALPQMKTASAVGSGETAQTTQKTGGNDLISDAAHKKIDLERRCNALRHEMGEAVKCEDFERAAKLRDELRGLEKTAGETQQ